MVLLKKIFCSEVCWKCFRVLSSNGFLYLLLERLMCQNEVTTWSIQLNVLIRVGIFGFCGNSILRIECVYRLVRNERDETYWLCKKSFIVKICQTRHILYTFLHLIPSFSDIAAKERLNIQLNSNSIWKRHGLLYETWLFVHCQIIIDCINSV